MTTTTTTCAVDAVVIEMILYVFMCENGALRPRYDRSGRDEDIVLEYLCVREDEAEECLCAREDKVEEYVRESG